jgi:hypothetical protein
MIHRTTLVKVFALGLTLAGCGGGDKPADSAASPPPVATTLAANECTREIPVPTEPAAVRQMKWKDGSGRGDGPDPQALFAISSVPRMCAIRMRFTLQTRDSKPAFLQVFWAKAGGTFSEASGSWAAMVESGPREQTLVVRGCSPPSALCADRDIGWIRIDPAVTPVDFQLAEMTVVAQ